MSWIIIIGVFILAAGPLFYLMPTAKDKRLTALRMNARQLGFTIQLDSLLKLDPTADERVTAGGQARSKKVECMRYQLAMGQTLDYVPPITLQRIPAATNIPVTVVMEGWGLPAETASNSRQAESHTNNVEAWQQQGELLKPIRTLLLALPEDVLGIAIDGRCVGAFWLERSGKQNVNKTLPETVIEPLQSIHTTLRKVIEIVKSHPWDLG
jgi:hypothetical protein|tara:strand:- start:229 stop:861 length:633 start_codon:yes stop_codon:yes gene_type:complete